MRHVLIATPSYGSQVYTNYTESLIQTCMVLSMNNIQFTIKFINNQIVTRARNMLCSIFMNDPNFTHMMFIDADISWNPQDILKLFNHDLECVVGIYPNKCYYWKNDKLTLMPSSKHNKHEEFSNLSMFSKNNDLIKIEHAATGFMLLTKNALKRIENDIDYFYLPPSSDSKEMIKLYNYFDCNIVNHDYLTEDYYFSYLYNKNGGTIYADKTISLTHFGPHEYGSLIKQ
jgi:hypothetical protein